MRNFVLICALAATLYSCKKSDLVVEPNTDNLEDGSLYTVSALKSSQSFAGADEDYNVLGYGYDLAMPYADSASIRASVVDIRKLKSEWSNAVDLSLASFGGPKVITAANAESYASDYSSRIKLTEGQKFFKSSLSSFYPEADAFSSKYIYGAFDAVVQLKQVKFAMLQGIQSYLKPSFLNDAVSLSPEGLVKKYGTHILNNISLGMKFSAVYQAQTKTADRVSASKKGLSIGVRRFFNSPIWQTDYTELQSADGNYNQKLRYKAYGADLSLIRKVYNAATADSVVKLDEWLQSGNKKNAALIDIVDLVPLYELLPEGAKRDALKGYITNYLKQNEVHLQD
ncbi:hypothetical protein GS399_16700 [Pedobacter sp. HMF7647]|uniref:MACPF domain-containing protein n=1 Tax=Hufsiella arboris TaxID=2695275 RepID=A0A7K1YDE4_9SPHI|nr:MAC/perforin domain-containing protein [Hufsiella arboris]MXV52615.1 hypothetical protein [Hufsiella arboris]